MGDLGLSRLPYNLFGVKNNSLVMALIATVDSRIVATLIIEYAVQTTHKKTERRSLMRLCITSYLACKNADWQEHSVESS